MNLNTIFLNWVDKFLTPLDDPGSRLFHVNILMSLAFVLIWILLTQKNLNFNSSFKTLKKLIFRKKYWWNTSTKLDYKIYLFNSLLKVFLFIPFLDFSYRFTKITIQAWRTLLGRSGVSLEATTLTVFLFTIAAFILDDFLRFIHHLLMHKIPFLWTFHKTHHSARILTPISLFRTHPIESAMAAVRNSLSTGIALGTFMTFFDGHFNLFTVFGINIFGFTFNFLASNLRHSHIALSFGFLEELFISPKQHQIHHSTNPEHFDKNFGVSLAIWDRLCSSLILSKDVNQKLRFGLTKNHRQSFFETLLKIK